MKIPRDLSAADLIKSLKIYGFEPTRQTGSHIRLTSYLNGEHHITIPNHNPLKLGTLNAILNNVAAYTGLEKSELVVKLF
jgi:predicted RNA binding protein YcfA (HicA-like mRNA interferase family)